MSPSSSRLETALNFSLIILALTVAAVLVRREFVATESGHEHSSDRLSALPPPVMIEGWEGWSGIGHWFGDPSAPVKLAVFSDYECPYCAQFDSAFRVLQDSLGESIAMLQIHFPLSFHQWAGPAAHIAECAARQSRLPGMHQLLYREAKLPAADRRQWGLLIRELGGIDEAEFFDCMSDSTATLPVREGRRLGESLGISSTPTVLINGFLYSVLPVDLLPVAVDRYLNPK